MGSAGQTNGEGAFELTLSDPSGKKGAVVGKHRVTVSRIMPESDSDMVTPLPPDPILDPVIVRIRKNPMEIEVPASGSKDLKIELKK